MMICHRCLKPKIKNTSNGAQITYHNQVSKTKTLNKHNNSHNRIKM
jgi:hypothetical protein